MNSVHFEINFPINFTKVYHGMLSSTVGFIGALDNLDEGAYISVLSKSTLRGLLCWNKQAEQDLYINALGV